MAEREDKSGAFEQEFIEAHQSYQEESEQRDLMLKSLCDFIKNLPEVSHIRQDLTPTKQSRSHPVLSFGGFIRGFSMEFNDTKFLYRFEISTKDNTFNGYAPLIADIKKYCHAQYPDIEILQT